MHFLGTTTIAQNIFVIQNPVPVPPLVSTGLTSPNSRSVQFNLLNYNLSISISISI